MLLRDALRESLQPILDEFSKTLSERAGLALRSQFWFNDYFVLRSFLCGVQRDGNEFSIAIDVRIEGRDLTVESDMGREDGKIYSEGPSLREPFTDDRQALSSFQSWLPAFRDYLTANEQYVIGLLSG